jgi:hypothetical protein
MRLFILKPQVNGSSHYSSRVILDQVAYRLDFYTGVVLPTDYPLEGQVEYGLWYWDLYDSNGAPLVMGQGLTSAVDLFYPFRARGVPPGRMFVRYNSSTQLDPEISTFEDNLAVVYYQAYQDVLDSGGGF